jgi:hypothetical protein
VKEFKEFPKIARFSRPIIITEKIDGTNASIYIGEDGEFLTGSRTQWITPKKDNYGFSRWAHERKDELLKLGVGHHYGEWWGQGIQRNYGLKEKRFSLFNVTRWCLASEDPKRIETADPKIERYQEKLPECVGLVPILYKGEFTSEAIGSCLDTLVLGGSKAVEGWMKPEGIVIYHPHGNYLFKKTVQNDEMPKSLAKNKLYE